jgi:glycosyltransferase involved in cell wall biosynthesis
MGEPARAGIVVNTRALGANLDGVQRYAIEVLERLGDRVETIKPGRETRGVKGHLWEQAVLPRRVGRRLLWSPTNSGPLAVRRQVLTLHDAVVLDHPEWFQSVYARWYRALLPRLVRRVANVITDSEFSKTRIHATTGVAEEKIHVVHIGVDPRFRPASSDEIANVRDRYGIPGERYLLSLGSIEPRQNHRRLVDAWARVERELPEDVVLAIAGAAGRSSIFREVSFDRKPDRLHFTGYVDDANLPALYSGAMAFAYLSSYEGFGLPPLEAMACGVPVLTGDRTSLPEVVGDAGVMVDPFDPDAIAESIRSLIADDSRRALLSTKGRERSSAFSWEQTADATWAVLTDSL